MRFFLAVMIAMVLQQAAAQSFGPQRWPRGLPEPHAVPAPPPAPNAPRVFRGSISNEEKIVAIFYREGGSGYLCSGLLVAKHYVLTAAHCACGTDYTVTNATEATADTTWRAASVESSFSQGFCGADGVAGGDLALLRLEYPLVEVCENYSLVPNIPLAGRWVSQWPGPFTVAGYGYDGDAPGSAGVRRAANMEAGNLRGLLCLGPLYSSLGCRRMREFVLSDRVTMTDSCGGDSGGPVYMQRGKNFVPIGVVSRGLPLPQPLPYLGKCGAGGIYTHLGREDVLGWLNMHIPRGAEYCEEAPH
jgi:hypothetical protein